MGENPALKDKDVLYCSFCGKSNHEVTKLIAGPTVFICDECVVLCVDILAEEKTAFVPSLEKLHQLDHVRTEIQEVVALIDAVAEPHRKTLEEMVHRLSVLGGLKKKLEAWSPAADTKNEPVRLPTPSPPPLES